MKIASFNIQKFGAKKMSKPDVVDILIKVKTETFDYVYGFIKKNITEENNEQPYSMELSKPLGRSQSKERFLFLYRKSVKVENTYQYPDTSPGHVDAFEREPFCVCFTCSTAAVKKLVLVPVHTKPTDSRNELHEVYAVIQDVKCVFHTRNVMLLGDFNADGKYLSEEQKKNFPIYTDKSFHWLIEDNVDTTTSRNNDYTYDRIVVCGKRLFDAVVPNSAKAFDFQQEFVLPDVAARLVSDHYPVEVELQDK